MDVFVPEYGILEFGGEYVCKKGTPEMHMLRPAMWNRI